MIRWQESLFYTLKSPFFKTNFCFRILNTFQESFILRLFREKKKGGFVKAFTDNAMRISSDGLGQLQRLMDKLYVRRIRLVPRFDVDVKNSYDCSPATLNEIYLDLPLPWRKIRNGLVDIIRTCVKELKQSSPGIEVGICVNFKNVVALIGK